MFFRNTTKKLPMVLPVPDIWDEYCARIHAKYPDIRSVVVSRDLKKDIEKVHASAIFDNGVGIFVDGSDMESALNNLLKRLES